jgi:hypothetical protein
MIHLNKYSTSVSKKKEKELIGSNQPSSPLPLSPHHVVLFIFFLPTTERHRHKQRRERERKRGSVNGASAADRGRGRGGNDQ